MSQRLSRRFMTAPALELSQLLLGKVLLVVDNRQVTAGLIAETEAYCEDDQASHSYRGQTPRTAPMFLAGGHSYVYFIYGMYHCFNIVADQPGKGAAVLIRGLATLPPTVLAREHAARQIGLPTITSIKTQDCDGPGKLCRTLGITRLDTGLDLTVSQRIWVEDWGVRPLEIRSTPRIGIKQATEKPWRFVVSAFCP